MRGVWPQAGDDDGGKIMRVAIIGGGMAGAACAYFLQQYDMECIIYDAAGQLASKGSGNSLGLYNPRFAAEWTAEAEFYKEAFELALQVFPTLGEVDWRPCGALHLMTTDQKSKRFHKMAQSWPWGVDMMRLLSAAEASDIAGVRVDYDALYLPQSGAVSPPLLCATYADGVEVCAQAVTDIDALDADIVILACGTSAASMTGLPLKPVRGQVTDVRGNSVSAALKTALCYSGYMMPADADGVHHVGSTFQRWLDHDRILPEDDQDNIDKFCTAVPALAGDYTVVSHRAGVRVAAPDHMPVIGHLRNNVYISAAHGSHGILSSLMGAKLLAAMIAGGDLPVSARVIERLSPQRFA